MATAKAERLLNLVIALVNSPRYRTAAWIRGKVAGYADAASDEAFFRTFERDKTELRDLGIPLQTDGADGYRIPPGEFALPELAFTPAETAALGLAGRLWETTALADAGSGALRKLRDSAPTRSGVEPVGSRSAAGLLQPRVRTGDPAFGPLFAAVQERRAVSFDYRKTPSGPAENRAVHPWGLVSFRGRWYLVGLDTARSAQRTFRLSRIVGRVRPVGRPRVVTVPPGLDLMAVVAESVEQPAVRTAVLMIRPGRAAGLRRLAASPIPETPPAADAPPAPETPAAPAAPRTPNARQTPGASTPGLPGWDRVEITLGHLWDTARTVAANGPDVMVVSPTDLREAVLGILTEAAVGVRR